MEPQLDERTLNVLLFSVVIFAAIGIYVFIAQRRQNSKKP
jgi:hypothetical protein